MNRATRRAKSSPNIAPPALPKRLRLERRQFAIAFGKVLKLLRDGANLSQEELAHRADLDRTTASLLELGKRSPMAYNLVRIARVLEIDPPLLLRMTLRRMEVER